MVTTKSTYFYTKSLAVYKEYKESRERIYLQPTEVLLKAYG
jgi:hypothetical protein